MTSRFDKPRTEPAAMLQSEARPEPDAKETIDLVRKTLDENGGRGLPKTSRARIRSAITKLKITGPGKGVSRRSEAGEMAAPATGARQRPDRLYLALTVFAVIFFVPPVAFAVIVLLTVVLVVTLYYAIGHDRVVGMAVAWHARVESRDPARAQSLRRRAARLSAAAARVAAWLPERWTQGLYLPDFEPEEDRPEKMQSDPFERLSMRAKA